MLSCRRIAIMVRRKTGLRREEAACRSSGIEALEFDLVASCGGMACWLNATSSRIHGTPVYSEVMWQE